MHQLGEEKERGAGSKRSREDRSMTDEPLSNVDSFSLSFDNSYAPDTPSFPLALVLSLLVILVSLSLVFWKRLGGPRSASTSAEENASECEGRSQCPVAGEKLYTPTVSIATDKLFPPYNSVSEAACAASAPATTVTIAPPLLKLAKISTLILLTQANDDGEEALARAFLLRELGLSVQPHKILFFESPESRASMVRQIQPVIHIESSMEIVQSLKQRVANVVPLDHHDPAALSKCVDFIATLVA